MKGAKPNTPEAVFHILQRLVDSNSAPDCMYSLLQYMDRDKILLAAANMRGETLLMTAAYYGRLDWVECLLKEEGVRHTINAADEDGVTALMHAAV